MTDSSKDRNKKADVKQGGASISKRTGLSSALKARLIRNTASEKSFSGGSFRDHMQQVWRSSSAHLFQTISIEAKPFQLKYCDMQSFARQMNPVLVT